MSSCQRASDRFPEFTIDLHAYTNGTPEYIQSLVEHDYNPDQESEITYEVC
jgi:hypothetical protein